MADQGWTLYPIVSFRSGFPLDVLAFAPGTSPSMSTRTFGAATLKWCAPTWCAHPVLRRHHVPEHQQQQRGAQSGNYYFNPNSFSNTRR